ncbi:MAG: 23S rRNA (guanosine(2251)-2'-O)-methyltransferase RlmB [bacterium]
MILTNKNSILEALRSGRKIYSVKVHRSAKRDSRLDAILKLCDERRIDAGFSDLALKQRGTGMSRLSVAAHCEDFRYAELEQELKGIEKRTTDFPLMVALNHVQDPGNLGALIRTCAAAGAAGIIIERHRCCAVTDAAADAASGGMEHIAIMQVANLVHALKKIKDYGCWVYGADEKAEGNIWKVKFNFPVCLVLGGEGEGLSYLVKKTCDFIVNIPTTPAFPTLNVSAAASAIVFELKRQWKMKNFVQGA